jgi:hypothetical protein
MNGEITVTCNFISSFIFFSLIHLRLTINEKSGTGGSGYIIYLFECSAQKIATSFEVFMQPILWCHLTLSIACAIA